MKSNYHTHTKLCNHAAGTVEDYVKEAIKEGLEVIGISDHVGYPIDTFSHCDDDYSRRRIFFMRMKHEEMDPYLSEIDECIKKYGTQIKILKSFESEYVLGKDEYYKDLLKKVDYLVLGQHIIFREENGKKIHTSSFDIETEYELELYRKQSKLALQTGYFKIFAHPDLYMNSYPVFDKLAREVAVDLIETAIEHNIILEYNANGVREGKSYPCNGFWDVVAKYDDVKVVLNSDCHKPEYLNDEAVSKAAACLEQLGIEYLKVI